MRQRKKMLEFKQGNILNATEKYIVHQCNCTTTSSAGLANQIFAQYPEANTYRDVKYKRQVGTISCHPVDNKVVINIYAQRYPGSAKAPHDTAEQRLRWFETCLLEISKIHPIREIAVPYKIGCGLAAGNWDRYLNSLQQFATRSDIRISIYKLDI